MYLVCKKTAWVTQYNTKKTEFDILSSKKNIQDQNVSVKKKKHPLLDRNIIKFILRG